MRYVFLKKKFGSENEVEISDWELAIKQTDIKPRERAVRTGLLLTAGFVAGEALTGVLVAILIVAGLNIQVFKYSPWWPGLIIWAYMALLLAYIPLREAR